MKPCRGIVKKLFASLLALIILTPSVPVISKTQYDRAAGLDRYSTSISISQRGWKSSEYAIITTGENFPDALGAAPLARKYNAPVLLTEKDVLRPDLEMEISRLEVKEIFILGGIGVISENIENITKGHFIIVCR